ncbi:MAG: putative virulence factor [Deltaproteobacteria bacterium]|jgi:hypothetical protein|nr:putative virulence factor [Deltaproteobacteria bacterium]
MTKLDDLKNTCLSVRQSALAGEKWLIDNVSSVGSQEALRKSLRRSARLLNSCARAADSKTGVAVFGPSQAGKSTLISALAKGPSGSLKVDFGPNAILDYMLHINPEGGNETTGLVTRFSLDRSIEPPDPALPVCLRLFNEIDIVKILANTFFGEAKGAVKLEPETIQKTLDTLSSRAPVRNGISLDDMEDLSEYVKSVSGEYASGSLLESHFWPRAIGLGQRLNLTDRAILFGFLWGNLTEFTQLYLNLLKALDQLGSEEIAFCGLNALYEPELNADSRKNSVLHVDRLLGLLSEEGGDAVTVKSFGGRIATLTRPILSALIAEIHVKMVEKPGPFMDYADILDFPGYRARMKLTDIANDIKNPEILKNCFLRGKVAYLFERYCARHEITAMLLCVADSVQNNPDLPTVINKWIKSAHGETPEDRFGQPICLFMVLTKFDRILERGVGASDLTTRWDNRYNASFLQFFSAHEWPLTWSKNGSAVYPFNNIFWLMNLGFADAFFKIERDATTGSIRSLGLRDDQIKWVDEVHAGYMASRSTAKHVQDSEAAWRAIINGSDGGASYIVEKLTPILATELKLGQLTNLALTESRLIEDGLKSYYQGGDKEEERKIKEDLFKKLASYLAKLAKKFRFGFFLKSIILSDDDCHSIFSQSFSENEFEVEETALDAPIAPLDDIESILFLGESQSSPDVAPKAPVVRSDDFASRYRRRLETAWQARLGEYLSEAKFLRYYGFTRDIFQQLISELVQGAKRLGVMDEIETKLRQALSYSNVNPERLLWKQSRLASTFLADFVNFLGLSPSRLTDEQRTVQILGRQTLLFARPDEPGDNPDLPEIQVDFDQLYFQDWLRAFYRLAIQNVDFAEKNYDIEANTRLGQIISSNRAAQGELGAA